MASPAPSPQPAQEQPAPSKQSYAEHKEQQKRLRKAQRAVEDCERDIAKMEARLKELDELLMQPQNASDMTLVTEYTTTRQALDRANEQWMVLSEQLEALQQA